MIFENRNNFVRAGAIATVVAIILLAGAPHSGVARSAAMQAGEGSPQPFAIEYYYKAKWGHAEEFLALFKKNHYPVLKKEMELGRMLKVFMTVPRYPRRMGAGTTA
jgi:hypothetical protein